MTENEINFDDWLDGVQRTERSVTLYGRADILADIDELEAQKRHAEQVPEEDRGYADSTGGKIQEKIDALYLLVDQSKMVFRVSFIDDEEHGERCRGRRRGTRSVHPDLRRRRRLTTDDTGPGPQAVQQSR